MPLCPKCNSEQPEGLNYCTKCGVLLKPAGVPSKKAIPKGLIFGGCGCLAFVVILVGILVLVAILMAGAGRTGPGASPQPPPVEKPAVTPERPIVTPERPYRPEGEQYPALKQGELIILFAKGLTEDGLPIGSTREFQKNDPQIVQIVRWGPDTIPVDAVVLWGWFYQGNTAVWSNYYTVQAGYMGVYDKVDRPQGGFPPGKYVVVVAVNGTPVVDHSFTVR